MSKFIIHTLPEKLRENSTEFHNLRQILLEISLIAKLSLRQVQSFVSNVSVSYLAARDGEFRPSFVVAMLGLLKAIEPGLFRKAKNSTLTWQEMQDFISGLGWSEGKGEHMMKVFRYYLDTSINVNDQEWRGWGDSMFRFAITRERVVPYLANDILDRFGTPLGKTGSELSTLQPL